jgi:hypothetical protein
MKRTIKLLMRTVLTALFSCTDNQRARNLGGKETVTLDKGKWLTTIYGKTEGKKCGACVHCKQHRGGSKRFYKCHLAKISSSQATDWNSRWDACGRFAQE